MTPRQRVPLYLTQTQIDALALLLYRSQTITNIVATGRHERSEEAACFLTELRQQCCVRSGADDPFPYLPLCPSFAEEESNRSGAWQEQRVLTAQEAA